MLKLSLILLCVLGTLGFQDCSKTKNTMSVENNKFSGTFRAELPKTSGFLKLQIDADGKVLFLNVVTLHLPPAELERLETKVNFKDGKFCFETKPQTVEQCAVSADSEEIVLKMESNQIEVRLKKENN